MAFDKKSSVYSDFTTFGSAEELDTYGVWVKSEPQDLASGLAGTVSFGGEAMPYTADFDAGFDGMGVSGMDLSDIDSEAPQFGIGLEDFEVASYDDEITVDEPHQEDMSTQVLAKIVNEISSIKSELTTLKKEFAEIRSESGSGGMDEALHDSSVGGFFEGADDEKVALTGDEMDSILTSTDFSSEDEFAFNSLREEDSAALKKLSEQNEASVINTADIMASDESQDEEGVEEEIEIDFDALGINLDDLTETGKIEAQEQASLVESDDMIEMAQDIQFGEEEPIPALDEIGEMRDLRLEGVEALTLAPDDTSYLEESPFSIENDVFEDLAPGENVAELSLDEASFDLGGFSDESTVEFDVELDDFSAESQLETLDLSDAVVIMDEPDLSAGIAASSLDEPVMEDPILEEPALEEISLAMEDFDTSIDMDAQDDSLIQIIPEGFELEVEEAATPFDDDLEAFVEEDLSVTGDDAGISAQPESLSASETVSDGSAGISPDMRNELRDVLSYMDHLLESLPEEKIEEFAQSEHFDTYKKIFKELKLA